LSSDGNKVKERNHFDTNNKKEIIIIFEIFIFDLFIVIQNKEYNLNTLKK
tara:strand:- start:12102 stop:12251 length:150 start_codon:yes stop_codon:yes gene_type:complete